MNRALPRFPAEPSGGKRPSAEIYGVISTVKQGFGFLQPIIEEDQIYFGGRELTSDMKVGDRVGFVTRESARGLAAENVRMLSGRTDVVAAAAKGTLSRGTDRHRSNFGVIVLDASSLDTRSAGLLNTAGVKELVFLPSDVVAKTVPKTHRLDKGDYVEFSVHRVIGSNLYLAKEVSLLQLKRDRAMAVQIQRMLEAGVAREQGVVSTVKRGEYGFIKPLDRKEDIYFRIAEPGAKAGGEGGNAEDSPESQLSEGDEVEFFVITECVKGKMSDRALHVRAVTRGTVKFEIVLASDVSATVIAESGARAEECPGIARLDGLVALEGADPVLALAVAAARAKKATAEDAQGGATLQTIELWQRCLPEDLVCRCGDSLQLDVHFYRPEKLFFARAVRVVRFRSLGRERGTVCAIKENGFGFIHSNLRNCDVYFKSSQVMGPTGAPLPEGQLKVGAAVSFDASCEEAGGGGKLRAKRVLLEETAGERVEARLLIRAGLTGVVVRNSTKKDSPGLIKVQPGLYEELGKLEFFDPEVVAALEEFQARSEMQSVTLPALPLSAVRVYTQTIEAKFPGVAHESRHVSASDPSLGYNLRVFKLPTDKYEEWRAALASPATVKGRSDGSTYAFYKDDYCSPEFGPLANDLRVVFSLVWDPVRGKRIARDIRLTDEAVEGTGEQRGVVDVLVDKADKYGFIRCVPSDEKLFWHQSSALAVSAPEQGQGVGAPLMLGCEVAFQLRRRGGLRCAADIRVLPAGTLSAEESLPGACRALVLSLSPPLLLLLDVSQVPELSGKYVDLRVMAEVNGGKADGQVQEQWGKVIMETGSPKEENQDPAALADGAGAEAATASRHPVGEEELQVAGDFKPKYFPPLPRSALPFTVSPEVLAAGGVQAGDLVSCTVAVKWAVQRHPFSAVVEGAAETAKATLRKGRITRPKFRVKAPVSSAFLAADALDRLGVGTVDMCELVDPGAEGGPLYCLSLELQPADDHSRDLPQPGDEVEFWVPPAALCSGVALAPRLLLKAKEQGIQFSKRPGMPSGAGDASKPKPAATALIVMAEGPPSDAAAGFPAGWRGAVGGVEGEVAGSAAGSAGEIGADLPPVVLAELPWAHLLGHLVA